MSADHVTDHIYIPVTDEERDAWHGLVRRYGLNVIREGLDQGAAVDEIKRACDILGIKEMYDLSERYPDAISPTRGGRAGRHYRAGSPNAQ